MNTRVSWLPFNSVPSTKTFVLVSLLFLFRVVEKEIILGNFIMSNGWYELDVRDSMGLSIDFRWIVTFELSKRNNSREFCVSSGWHDWYFYRYFHFFTSSRILSPILLKLGSLKLWLLLYRHQIFVITFNIVKEK